MDPRLANHLKTCKLDEKRFEKLLRLIEVMRATSDTAEDMLIKFADKCYGKEKDRNLAKIQAKTFIDVLFGSAEQLFRDGSRASVQKVLEEQERKPSITGRGACIKTEVLRDAKSEDFIPHLHGGGDETDLDDDPMWTRKLNHYLVGPTLGVGGTAKVKLAYNPKTKTKVALKILKPKYADSAQKEIDILKKLNHKNIVQVYDCFSNVRWDNTSTTVFAIEYASQGELIEYLMYTSKFEDDLARWFFVSLTEGIEYCHGQKIVHRDLKHDNCLLGEDFVLKITDFGFATHYSNELMKTAIGTAQYAAPEVLRGKKYTDAVDIFSMGVMLFIALAGSQPWKKASAKNDRWYKMVHAGDWKKFFEYHQRSHKFTRDQKTIIRGLLEPKAADRWTLEQIKRCSWFNGKRISQGEVASRLRKRKKTVDEKKFKAMQSKKKQTDRRNIYSTRLPYTYFQLPPTLSFVTSKQAEWVLEDIVDVIGALKGSVLECDRERYKVSFEVSKNIDSGSNDKETREKVYEKVQISASVQMWTHPGQGYAIEEREKIISAMEEKDMTDEDKEAVKKKLPEIKSIAVFRAEGGDQIKYLFPGVYSDILVRLPADVISRNEMDDLVGGSDLKDDS